MWFDFCHISNRRIMCYLDKCGVRSRQPLVIGNSVFNRLLSRKFRKAVIQSHENLGFNYSRDDLLRMDRFGLKCRYHCQPYIISRRPVRFGAKLT